MKRITLLLSMAVVASTSGVYAQEIGWRSYGGDPGGTRYSPLNSIDTDNVGQLELAWTYRTGELGQGADDSDDMTFQSTPILVEGMLYVSTAFGKVIALDPTKGVERWSHDPDVRRGRSYSEVTNRGVSAWVDEQAPTGAACRLRIFVGTIDARLIAIDGKTGEPCRDFGHAGTVNLAQGMGSSEGDYQVTSAPAIINDLVVVGSSIGDNWNRDTGNGVVRAFDARSGRQQWAWDPIPRDSTSFVAGAANAWSTISVDPDRDLVFVPTSSPSPDFYGGDRLGDNTYGNSLVALRGSTGELVWAFQTVHHDLWDYDIAAQPALVEFVRGGRQVAAVVQATKMGMIFVLDRETGEPIFPVEERAVRRSDVPGEESSPTQPFSTLPTFMPQGPLHAADVFGLDDADRRACVQLVSANGRRSNGIYTPPSLEGTVMYPGNGAGVNWGSVSFHHERNLLILNTTRLATLVQLMTREDFNREVRGNREPGFEYGRMGGSPYGMKRATLLSPQRLPCNPPPWGTLAALDLSTGEVAWEIPLGETPERYGIPAEVAEDLKGWPNNGGSIVTAGGVVFIGATMDQKFRAFDVANGNELWKTTLPRAGIATPMTYAVEGKQFVVITAGGHGKWGLEQGDFVMAFALPESR